MLDLCKTFKSNGTTNICKNVPAQVKKNSVRDKPDYVTAITSTSVRTEPVKGDFSISILLVLILYRSVQYQHLQRILTLYRRAQYLQFFRYLVILSARF